MVKRQESGEWSLSDADLRRLAVIVSLCGGLFTAGVAWAAASMKVDQMSTRLASLEASVQDLTNIREDIRALLRFRCIDSTDEQRRLAGIRCENGATRGTQ